MKGTWGRRIKEKVGRGIKTKGRRIKERASKKEWEEKVTISKKNLTRSD